MYDLWLVFLTTLVLLAKDSLSFSTTDVSSSVTQKLEIQPLRGGSKISLKEYISNDKTLFIFGTCKFLFLYVLQVLSSSGTSEYS
jgi:hypothetical protein